MIKWIKFLIEKIFGKFCKCEEPIILEEETKKEDVEEVAPVKIDHCGEHLWYKKSCPDCRKAIK